MKFTITLLLTGLFVAATSAVPVPSLEPKSSRAPCQRNNNLHVVAKPAVHSDWRLENSDAGSLAIQREPIGIVVPRMDFD